MWAVGGMVEHMFDSSVRSQRRDTTAPREGFDRHHQRGELTMTTRTMRRQPPVTRASRDLLADAGRGLGTAIRAADPAERYAAAHLAALRGAAALLASRARPGRGRLGNAWDLLGQVAPDLVEWAGFFKAGAGKRQLAEAGIARAIGAREADDMLRQTSEFVDLIEARLDPSATTASQRALLGAGSEQPIQ